MLPAYKAGLLSRSQRLHSQSQNQYGCDDSVYDDENAAVEAAEEEHLEDVFVVCECSPP